MFTDLFGKRFFFPGSTPDGGSGDGVVSVLFCLFAKLLITIFGVVDVVFHVHARLLISKEESEMIIVTDYIS